jgi:hypothetical protein
VGDITLPTGLREIRQREKMLLAISMLGITYENMLCYNETKLKRYVISTAST